MIKGARLEGGVVTGVIMLNAQSDAAAFGVTPCGDDVHVGWVYDGTAFTPPPTPTEPPLTQSQLLARVANRRWLAETGGLVVGGVSVATDDRSKTLLMGARLRADSDPAVVEEWEAADGSVYTLDAVTIVSISNAVANHVSACFSRSAAVKAAVLSGAVTEASQIDEAFADVNVPWNAPS